MAAAAAVKERVLLDDDDPLNPPAQELPGRGEAVDPGAEDVLEAYEKARRFDTVAMGVVTDGLNRLFSNDSTPLRLVRDLGLGMVERLPGLKRMFIREAAGLSAEAPRLLRGEML